MDDAVEGSPWVEGERIRVRGAGWTIDAVASHPDCVSLRLLGPGSGPATILTPFDRPRRLSAPSSCRIVHRRRWLHAVRRAACECRPFGAVADPPDEVALLPYQLEPTLAVVRHGASRILLADGVGLGKTVQSGLLLHTLRSRDALLRAMVVAPAGLRDQWAREMRDRFSLEVEAVDAGWLRRAERELPPGVSPWTPPGVYVISFDFLKRPEVLGPLEELAWDLVVVDEAHNAGAATARRAAIDAVASRSLRVLLLTATPHAGDDGQFRALCDIGAATPGEPIVLFRRSRASAGHGVRRRSTLLTIAASAEERQVHRLLDHYTRAVSREGRGDARLLATILKKRALSSAASLALSLRRRRDLLAGIEPSPQLLLPLDDEAMADDVPDAALGAPGLDDVAREQRLLRRLTAAAGSVGRETKSIALLRLLRRVKEPALVFTEYRDTLVRLHALVTGAGHDALMMHGGQPAPERSEIQRRFTERGQVLLATDAAAEGLNLHRRCRLVIHYELPWTPSRLEQRTGRVDRIGQQRTVHEVLLVGGDAAERLVLVPLARRARRAQAALGDPGSALDRLGERLVAEAIFGRGPLADPPEPQGAPTSALDLGRDAAVEVERLARRRAWRRQSSLPESTGVHRTVVARARRSARRRVAVYLLTLTSESGHVVHGDVVAVRGARCTDPRRVLTLLAPATEGIGAAARAVEAAFAARVAGLTARVRSTARVLVQAGLFDRRAARLLERRERGAAGAADALRERAATLRVGRLIARLEPIAVLLE